MSCQTISFNLDLPPLSHPLTPLNNVPLYVVQKQQSIFIIEFHTQRELIDGVYAPEKKVY